MTHEVIVARRRMVLLAAVTCGYGQFNEQHQFPPDIVPPELLARRDPVRVDPSTTGRSSKTSAFARSGSL